MPLVLVTLLMAPFCATKSSTARPATDSLKTTVTVGVSPICRAVSLSVMLVTVGATLSTR